MPSSRDGSTPVVESGSSENLPEVSVPALQQRIRQQEILATLGVTALHGASVEVETLIRTHGAVEDVAVVGLPDDRWGELVCAAVVVRGGATLPTVEELRAHLDGSLIGAKQPRVVVQVDALPRTDATGQVRRRRLRDQIVAGRGA